MTGHVPGPWYVVQHIDGGWTIQDRECGAGNCVAAQYGRSAIENASLIAAAPEIHTALQMLLVEAKHAGNALKQLGWSTKDLDKAIAEAMKALGKAVPK